MAKKIKQTKSKSVLLAEHISPIKYDLTLKPDLENFTFSGKEIIEISVSKATKSITLHSKDIDIETVSISKNKTTEYSNKISYDKKSETATFYFKNSIGVGKMRLSLVFKGIISDSLRGFYRSKYILNNETKHIATTQFEATDARRAFPSFDEPAHKAVFNVSLIVPSDHTAISNTIPQSIKEHEAGYKIVRFSPTPRMSTYLLAFIIGKFDCVENYKNKSTKIRVFTTPGKSDQAKFALEVAAKCIEYYNNYFDIPYPLPVLDMIAIPDFESGAMENWGAITYRETAILVDEEHSSLANRQWVALVVAHEIAHQWFGNLVTMHWWTDLWLNEGFASYIEYLAVDHIFPKWKIWDQFLTSDMSQALGLDALANSHPIEVKVNHPEEISEIFDMISYSKGASIIRMLAEYLGHDKFRDGLRHYLKKHRYKNTRTVDLWKSFENISKKPVTRIMQNWTSRVGYPLLILNKNKSGYKITQERFFSSRISAKKFQDKTLWHVPLIYGNSRKTTKDLLIKKSLNLGGDAIGKVNKGESTLVRVKYDKDSLDKIKEDIVNGDLPLHDRLGVIRDLFALAEGGYINTDEVIEFSLVYEKETKYIIWLEIASGINKIYNLIQSQLNARTMEKYHEYARSLFSPLAKRMTWQKKAKESHADTLLRSLSISQAGTYGDRKIIKKAQRLFKDGKSIDADIRSAIYNIVAQNGNQSDWIKLKKLYNKTELHEEKDRLSRALAMFKDKTLLMKTLNFTLSKEVRDQDAPRLIASVWTNPRGRDLTWKFIKRNWNVILKKYGEGGHFLSRLLAQLGNHTKSKDAKEAKKFFSRNSAPGTERTLEQAYERIYSNEAWLNADLGMIKNWLNNN